MTTQFLYNSIIIDNDVFYILPFPSTRKLAFSIARGIREYVFWNRCRRPRHRRRRPHHQRGRDRRRLKAIARAFSLLSDADLPSAMLRFYFCSFRFSWNVSAAHRTQVRARSSGWECRPKIRHPRACLFRIIGETLSRKNHSLDQYRTAVRAFLFRFIWNDL